MDKHKLELFKGVRGYHVYLNNFRIAGGKPWGGAKIVQKWIIDEEDIFCGINNCEKEGGDVQSSSTRQYLIKEGNMVGNMMGKKTTWRKMIKNALESHGESWADVKSNTLTEQELDLKFDPGWGGIEGIPFTLWTKTRVYFPGTYAGAEWVASVARNPDGMPTDHVGGG